VVGIGATALDFAVLFISTALGTPTIMANIISTGVSFCFSFWANKNYTFKTHGANLKREIALFVLVTLFGLWVIQSVILGLVEPAMAKVLSEDELQLLAAKLVATAVTTVWNYILYSRVVFTHKPRE
jgi:putative flippase GtrA